MSEKTEGQSQEIDIFLSVPQEEFNYPIKGGCQRKIVLDLYNIKKQVKEALQGSFSKKQEINLQKQSEIIKQLQIILQSDKDFLKKLDKNVRKQLLREIREDIFGYSRITDFIQDNEITEIMAIGNKPIIIEKGGKLTATDKFFACEEELRNLIERIVSQIRRKIDESTPFVDARLPDGSRVNAIIPPLSLEGSILTIRKFPHLFSLDQLIHSHTLTRKSSAFLKACIIGRKNILVSGGTGSGKTTLLNVFGQFIPQSERVITIENIAELKLGLPIATGLEYRPPNIEGRGEITVQQLVVNALRMRPDRIIVGEVRHAEALDMIQAMNTGHDGSMSTIHANNPYSALLRLETCAAMAKEKPPADSIRRQIADAINIVVQVARLKDGSRKVISIQSLEGLDDSFNYKLKEIFKPMGQSFLPTGQVPDFLEDLKEDLRGRDIIFNDTILSPSR